MYGTTVGLNPNKDIIADDYHGFILAMGGGMLPAEDDMIFAYDSAGKKYKKHLYPNYDMLKAYRDGVNQAFIEAGFNDVEVME